MTLSAFHPTGSLTQVGNAYPQNEGSEAVCLQANDGLTPSQVDLYSRAKAARLHPEWRGAVGASGQTLKWHSSKQNEKLSTPILK